MTLPIRDAYWKIYKFKDMKPWICYETLQRKNKSGGGTDEHDWPRWSRVMGTYYTILSTVSFHEKKKKKVIRALWVLPNLYSTDNADIM